MAGTGRVWGIDIGQCGLKALRGRATSDGIQVDSFDYIEYPKILTQPDADPEELVREALKQFLSRNSLRGDKVAIAVSGQSGLARFIKLPPVDEKKLPDLVQFEAKQQIPFALEDVVWDFQKLPTLESDEDEDIGTEVGLFAMKRDQLQRLLKPLVDQDVEIDIVQLAPVSVFNAVAHDRLIPLTETELLDARKWVTILSIGTESSDLVVTNGMRIWQRSIPIGGNHFTKQLTTDLKLTFANAELAKRNAREAADPRAIFQSMRPVFSDLSTQIQRSLAYFGSLEKKAKVEKLYVLGNAIKLPGLTQFLEKNLELPVERFEKFEKLTGEEVLGAATFADNAATFPVVYGLITQGLGQARIRTNLIPREIIRSRHIRAKKPWLAAMAAALLAAFAFNYMFYWRAWNEVNLKQWESVKSSVTTLQSTASSYESKDTELKATIESLDNIGAEAVGAADGRVLWLELLKAITASLPVDESIQPDSIPTLDKRPLESRTEIFIDSIESQYFPDITTWYTEQIKQAYQQAATERKNEEQPATTEAPAEGDAPPAEEGADATTPPAETAAAAPAAEGESEKASADVALPELSGGAWVIQIKGHHFQHELKERIGDSYLRKTLLDQLEFGEVELPIGPDGKTEKFTVKELGIVCPVMIRHKLDREFTIPNPKAVAKSLLPGMPIPPPVRPVPGQANAPKTPPPPVIKPTIPVPRYEFTVQFCWKQTPLRARVEARQKAAEEAAAGETATGDEGVTE
jgi:type IV pilus assembly protein PilM